MAVKVHMQKGDSKSKCQDIPVLLRNGDLVVIGNQTGDKFMVVSYQNEDGSTTNANGYCSLIQLSSGTRAFREHSSRNTTLKRISSHLNNSYLQVTPNNNQRMSYVTDPNAQIKVIDREDFSLTISL